jgi:hypothetical protein
MHAFRRFAVVAATAAALVVPVAASGVASAATRGPAPIRMAGQTTVTTAPGIASALLGAGIVPLAVNPGQQTVLIRDGQPLARFAFPVTGGWARLHPLSGTIEHRGGILFTDLKTGKQVEVGNFTVRIAIFNLSLAHARLWVHGHIVRAANIMVTLTATAAKALNATLGTALFQPGMTIGTAATTLRI